MQRNVLSQETRCTTAVCDNAEGSVEYYAKRKKSDREGQEPYDFSHMWDVKQKATNKLTDADMVVAAAGTGAGRGCRGGRGSNIYGGGRRPDFGCGINT